MIVVFTGYPYIFVPMSGLYYLSGLRSEVISDSERFALDPNT